MSTLSADENNAVQHDDIELDYEREIKKAMSRGDNDMALDLANGLKEYKKYFKNPDE